MKEGNSNDKFCVLSVVKSAIRFANIQGFIDMAIILKVRTTYGRI